MSAAILPLATTYNICEGLDSIRYKPAIQRTHAVFFTYTALITSFSAGHFCLHPSSPLLQVILVFIANGILLQFVLAFMLLLVNRRSLMGDYRNSTLGQCDRGRDQRVVAPLPGPRFGPPEANFLNLLI